MSKFTLESVVAKVNDMKPLPVAVGKIIELTEDPKATIQDLEDAILRDQALTTKILRVANSAYYTYNRKISTISQAAVLIGFKAIKGIAFASVLSKVMNKELKGYEMEKDALWVQSQVCAIGARELAKRIKYKDQEEAYIAGLLHDVGKTIMSEYLETEYSAIMEKVQTKGISFDEAEMEVLGFSHTDIGSKVAEKWNLPRHLVDGIKYHHKPELANDNITLVNIVHIADAMTMMMGVGMGADGMNYSISEKAVEMLGIDEIAIQDLISTVTDIVQNEDNFLLSS